MNNKTEAGKAHNAGRADGSGKSGDAYSGWAYDENVENYNRGWRNGRSYQRRRVN